MMSKEWAKDRLVWDSGIGTPAFPRILGVWDNYAD